MKRSELKAIIKECIVEILAEGIGDLGGLAEGKRHKRELTTQHATMTKKSVLDSIRPKVIQERIIPPSAQNLDMFKEIAGNDAMAAIFADTASTTLREQASENRNPAIETGVDPNLFENAENWATLAFADPIRK